MNYHISVLLQEAIDALGIKSGHKYIDATLGGGGHTKVILDKGGFVLAIDADEDAIKFANSKLLSPDLKLARGNFRNIDQIALENGFEEVSGIIFDLGVSSHQIDTPERGFSYLKSGPLDMRMDQRLGVKAKDLINALGKNELYELFRGLGEEKFARRIAVLIDERRKMAHFETTDELTDILSHAYGFRDGSTDFAKSQSSKRVFQALRIAVNDEIESLEEALPKAFGLLEKSGRLAVISFHSLEDRTVKNSFRELGKEGRGRILTKKPILPSEDEVKANKRSKEAKLRIIEKIRSASSE